MKLVRSDQLPSADWSTDSPFDPGEADEVARTDADLARSARAEEVCDAARDELQTLGSQLVEILDHLEGFFPELVAAAGRYDDAVRRHLPMLEVAGTPSARFESPHRGRPVLDGVEVRPCHADRHLLGRLALTLRDLGAPEHLVRDIQMQHSAAPRIPRVPPAPPASAKGRK